MVPDEAAECAGKAIASAMIFSPPRPSRRPDLPLTLSPIRSPVILERAFSEIETLGGSQWRRFGADLTFCDLRFVRCLQWFEPFLPYLQPKLYSDLHHWDQGFKQSEGFPADNGFYYVLAAEAQKTIAAVSYCRENNHGWITFKPDLKFVRDYDDLLELGDDLECTAENDLVIWLEPLCRIHLCDIALLILKENKDKRDAEFNERFKHQPPKALD
ncbi:hypothetical protein RHMOL_Rhmol08G0198800 [Rhododendron molle]|uniref:Uncharacterized protein n=1 Tax=Rhododendron molle TaxID=49168 RepID=A0ACC0MSA9_RHOML|nr:hypothetical protein RHMOL_Rhmol08G0198800 [Rhododendron molle]